MTRKGGRGKTGHSVHGTGLSAARRNGQRFVKPGVHIAKTVSGGRSAGCLEDASLTGRP